MDIHNLPDKNIYDYLGKPDYLFHFAWDGLPNYMSLHHYENVLPLQYEFLKKTISDGVKSILVTGTCFEYGMKEGELDEGINTDPQNPYGFAKDCLRKQLFFLKDNYDFSLAWCRLFYMYGEDQPDNTLYKQLINTINASNSTFNMSGGEQIRDYLDVKDVVHYLIDVGLKNQGLELINIGSGKPIKIIDLVNGWLEKSDVKIKLNTGYYPYPNYEPMAFWANVDKLNKYIK